MSNCDRYRYWLRKIREKAHEPVIDAHWFAQSIDDRGAIYSFTIPKDALLSVMRGLQMAAQQMRPCDESYYMTMDIVGSIRNCINLGDRGLTVYWRD